MGWETSASRKEWVNAKEPNLRLTDVEPKEGMTVPLAATNGAEVLLRPEEVLTGNTETSAPLSTK